MFILCVHRLVFYILSTVLPYLWFTLYFHNDFYVCTGKMLIFACTWIKFHRVPEVLALDLMDTENYLFKSVDISLIDFGTCTCCFTLLLSFKSYAMLVFMYEVSLTICSYGDHGCQWLRTGILLLFYQLLYLHHHQFTSSNFL